LLRLETDVNKREKLKQLQKHIEDTMRNDDLSKA
jgi:hypothetical protein